jgi:hypothetical protein
MSVCKSIFALPALLIFVISCTDQTETQQNRFLASYSDYCGYAYKGATNFVDLASGDLFEEAELTMVVTCDDEDAVRLPFIVDEDSSRTWIVKRTPQGLHLSHDHRYHDGTQHDNNFYGGYADSEGSATLQYFPADHRTIEDRPARSANRWAKEFDLANQAYFYRLYLNGELRLEAEFDLSNPVEI